MADKAMSGPVDPVAAVAEAIWRADYANELSRYGGLVTWTDVADVHRDRYRRMAEAAVAALGLWDEWGHGIVLSSGSIDANANVYDTEAKARKGMREINEVFPDDRRRVIHRFGCSPWRLVGPWVSGGTATKELI